MLKNKTFLTLIGFLLAGTGFLAIFLGLVGVDFAILHWMRSFSGLGALLAKVIMIMLGFIFLFFGQTDLEKEDVF